jgi:hypothetical protein
MAMNLIQNVLGFTMILFVVSACSSIPEPIEISAKPVDKPILVLPQADALQSRDVEWIIITESNLDEQIKKLQNSKKPVVFFALTEKGYENLSLNLNDLRTFIQQQRAIVAAYERYYMSAEQRLDQAVVLE